jgi:hypothetical protein
MRPRYGLFRIRPSKGEDFMDKMKPYEDVYVTKCVKCQTEAVCEVTITVWDGTERQGGQVLALCGECLDKFAEDYNLKDDNGGYGKNFTLQGERYINYLKKK